ncbi:hypothetical protein RBWH47_02172 [Rhodopirellula baltica WH47]|uniref:Uncharacterized protein n=1 Tax=Rhodopirellula baltica WH47 TaxID=991778 RepID=F2B0D3_RHOBT|nr:hypothetical protein RBWH47_02172 [Rhodopirellula baltica WH47]
MPVNFNDNGCFLMGAPVFRAPKSFGVFLIDRAKTYYEVAA